MLRAIYPGSFDPITVGHLDILDRALNICSEVTIVVAGSGRKAALLTPEERVEVIREAVAGRKNVKVDYTPGLIMDYARKHGVRSVIRGLRAASDFEYEFMMASMNKQLNPEVETVFMMSAQSVYFVSSSMIKELFLYGGDISHYVPPAVVERLQARPMPIAKKTPTPAGAAQEGSLTLSVTGAMTLKLRFEGGDQDVELSMTGGAFVVRLSDGTEFRIPIKGARAA